MSIARLDNETRFLIGFIFVVWIFSVLIGFLIGGGVSSGDNKEDCKQEDQQESEETKQCDESTSRAAYSRENAGQGALIGVAVAMGLSVLTIMIFCINRCNNKRRYQSIVDGTQRNMISTNHNRSSNSNDSSTPLNTHNSVNFG